MLSRCLVFMCIPCIHTSSLFFLYTFYQLLFLIVKCSMIFAFRDTYRPTIRLQTGEAVMSPGHCLAGDTPGTPQPHPERRRPVWLQEYLMQQQQQQEGQPTPVLPRAVCLSSSPTHTNTHTITFSPLSLQVPQKNNNNILITFSSSVHHPKQQTDCGRVND